MIIESILAILSLAAPKEAPVLVEPFQKHAQCMEAAAKANMSDPRLKAPELAKYAPIYVCLRVTLPNV